MPVAVEVLKHTLSSHDRLPRKLAPWVRVAGTPPAVVAYPRARSYVATTMPMRVVALSTRRSDACTPSVNSRRPLPSTTGAIISRYFSITSAPISSRSVRHPALGTHPGSLRPGPIHPSAWKGYSQKFARRILHRKPPWGRKEGFCGFSPYESGNYMLWWCIKIRGCGIGRVASGI
jgi:hypothetical protein